MKGQLYKNEVKYKTDFEDKAPSLKLINIPFIILKIIKKRLFCIPYHIKIVTGVYTKIMIQRIMIKDFSQREFK
jgi:hypothetical protein